MALAELPLGVSETSRDMRTHRPLAPPGITDLIAFDARQCSPTNTKGTRSSNHRYLGCPDRGRFRAYPEVLSANRNGVGLGKTDGSK
jgi:hypothetical protein